MENSAFLPSATRVFTLSCFCKFQSSNVFGLFQVTPFNFCATTLEQSHPVQNFTQHIAKAGASLLWVLQCLRLRCATHFAVSVWAMPKKHIFSSGAIIIAQNPAKGRLQSQIWMNFRKTSRGGGGVISDPKNFGAHCSYHKR